MLRRFIVVSSSFVLTCLAALPKAAGSMPSVLDASLVVLGGR
jgi:hypothetical protein